MISAAAKAADEVTPSLRLRWVPLGFLGPVTVSYTHTHTHSPNKVQPLKLERERGEGGMEGGRDIYGTPRKALLPHHDPHSTFCNREIFIGVIATDQVKRLKQQRVFGASRIRQHVAISSRQEAAWPSPRWERGSGRTRRPDLGKEVGDEPRGHS